jgi:hypothetical protein
VAPFATHASASAERRGARREHRDRRRGVRRRPGQHRADAPRSLPSSCSAGVQRLEQDGICAIVDEPHRWEPPERRPGDRVDRRDRGHTASEIRTAATVAFLLSSGGTFCRPVRSTAQAVREGHHGAEDRDRKPRGLGRSAKIS